MHALIYVSEETARLEPDELMALLRASRARNRELGVTGLLAYRDGQFMQILEGEQADVREIYGSIAQDPRHQQVHPVWDEAIEMREFAAWPMAFRFLSDAQVDRLPHFEQALNDGFAGSTLRGQPAMARSLMLALRDVF